MTVAELIEKLKLLPQDLPVRYSDSDLGNCDVESALTDYDHYTNWAPSLRPEKPTQVILS